MDRSMGSKKKEAGRDGDAVSSDWPEVTLLAESLMEAQRLANELKACPQLDQHSSSMAEGISDSLSRANMLLLQSQSVGRWSLLMAQAPASHGRGGRVYKTRNQASQGCRKELRNSVDDAYSWRKYGQKVISTAKYPRSYFRCKHRYEQLCPATRQVQRSEADPSMLEITYIGDHTCCTQRPQHPSTMAGGATASNTSSSIIKYEDAPPPSTEKFRRDHQAPADHDDGAPAHRLDLDGSFPCVTAGDLQMEALELNSVHAYGDDLIFDAPCHTTDTYYTAAAGEDDELTAAVSSFGGFTNTSTSAMIWELISTNNICTD